jgi:hypothetical protein
MAKSLAIPSGFPTPYARRAAPFSARRVLRRIGAWFSNSQQRDVERDIESYLANRGFDHFTDSIERDIEHRFLARQRIDF